MSCFHPLKAYWRSVDRSGITFDINHSATRVPFNLPCGRCIGCRMEKARQWGVRCLHEAKLHRQNSYVTLTYNDASLPPGGTLVLRDVQLFMKKLRKAREPDRVRFFLGGEYGEGNSRPHYHALLFNCGFADKRLWNKNKRGEDLYCSKELESLWGLGFCTIGDVTFDSAVYCAKYALKKVNGDAAYSHYQFMDADGELFDRRPEFAIMSRRPGIGAGYFDKYGKEIMAHDSVIVNGVECTPPRFYSDKAKAFVGPSHVPVNMKLRKREGVLSRGDNTAERLRVKEQLAVHAAKKKERTL